MTTTHRRTASLATISLSSKESSSLVPEPSTLIGQGLLVQPMDSDAPAARGCR